MPVYREWSDVTKSFLIQGLWQPVAGLVPGNTVGPVAQWLWNDKGGLRADTTTMSGYLLVAESSLDGAVNWLRSGPDILNQGWIEVAVTGIDNTGNPGMPAQVTDWTKLGAGRGMALNDIPKNCARKIEYRVVVPLGANNAAVDWRLVPDAVAPSIGATELNLLWTSVPYNAANFSGAPGTWTVDPGDQVKFQYILVGTKLMGISFIITGTDVAGSPSTLQIKIPGGFAAHADYTEGSVQTSDAGVVAYAPVIPIGQWLYIYRPGFSSAWTNTSSDNTYVRGTVWIRLA